MKLEKVINKRCSCREFSKRKVRWDKILEAIDAACHVPLAGNSNDMKFLIVQEKETIKKIAYHCQQDWIADAPSIVVVTSDPAILERQYDERGLRYSRQQVGAAIQNFLLRITDLGLASCWVGAYSDEMIKQLLKIPGHVNVEAILPIGKPKNKPKQSKKPALENHFYWETWNQKKKPTLFKDPTTLEGGIMR